MYGYSLEHTNFYVIQPGLIWMFMPEADTLALQLSMNHCFKSDYQILIVDLFLSCCVRSAHEAPYPVRSCGLSLSFSALSPVGTGRQHQ